MKGFITKALPALALKAKDFELLFVALLVGLWSAALHSATQTLPKKPLASI